MLSLFTDDITVYVENWKESTKTLLKIISYYSKLAEHKVNKSQLLSSILEQREFEIKNTLSLTSAAQKVKYLGINLIKYVQDLYKENYKTLMNEIKEELNKWR